MAWYYMNASNLVYIVALMVIVVSTSPVVEGENLSSENNITVTLKYAGELSIRVADSYIYDVLGEGLSNCDSTIGEVYLTIKYVLDVNVTIDAGLKPRAVSLALNTENYDVLSNHQCIEEFFKNAITSWNMSGMLEELHYVPIALRLKKGSIEFEYPRREGVIVAVTRYGGLDIVQVKNEYFVSSLISGISIYGFNLYYEPLTGIPVHYVEVSTVRNSNGTLSYMLFVTLYKHDLNYSELFKDLINRRTFDVSLNVTLNNDIRTYKAVLALVYVRGVDDVDIKMVAQNNTVWVTINPSTTCFLVFGPLRDPVEQTSIKLEYYTTRTLTGPQYVYYTPEPIECSEFWIQLPSPVTEYEHETVLPELLPPPRPPPSADIGGYVVAAVTTAITILLTFLACGYIAKRVTT